MSSIEKLIGIIEKMNESMSKQNKSIDGLNEVCKLQSILIKNLQKKVDELETKIN